jgi:hypothetical protein
MCLIVMACHFRLYKFGCWKPLVDKILWWWGNSLNTRCSIKYPFICINASSKTSYQYRDVVLFLSFTDLCQTPSSPDLLSSNTLQCGLTTLSEKKDIYCCYLFLVSIEMILICISKIRVMDNDDLGGPNTFLSFYCKVNWWREFMQKNYPYQVITIYLL